MEKNITHFKHVIDSLDTKEYIKIKEILKNEDEINNILLSLKKNIVILPIGKNSIIINSTKELINCIIALWQIGLKN